MRLVLVLIGFLLCPFLHAQSGYAVNLDGTDDYVSLPAASAVGQLNSFTVESWVYWNGVGNGCIYSETILGNDDPMFSISPRAVDAGRLEITFRDQTLSGLMLQPANGAVASNRWVHVAVVRTSATNIKVYIDGVLTDDVNFTAPAAWTPDRVIIGARERTSIGGLFGGQIDETRIWNVARTQAEIKATMFGKNLENNAPGLVARFRFNEGTGVTAANSSTNTLGIDGTLTNGPTWTSSPIQFGRNAIHFDQANDRFGAPLPSTATSNFTIEGWFYHNGGRGTDHTILTYGTAGSNGVAVFINIQLRVLVNVSGTFYNPNIYIPTNQWCHLALVFGGTGFTVYKDGVAVASFNVLPSTPTGSFVMGYRDGLGQPYDGGIDEVRFWNVARTAAEIQNNMYNELDPATPGLTAYYTFNQGSADGNNAGLTTIIDQAGSRNGTISNFALSGTTSNYIPQRPGLFVLPVHWENFSATTAGDDVLLEWTTSQELQNLGFAVQHSSDGTGWNTIASLASQGNAAETNTYRFTHTQPVQGRNFYRIQQTDVDGQKTYSETRWVQVGSDYQMKQVLINPVRDGQLRLQVTGQGQQTVRFIDSQGKLLWTRQLTMGFHSIQLGSLAKGVYLVQIGDRAERILIQ